MLYKLTTLRNNCLFLLMGIFLHSTAVASEVSADDKGLSITDTVINDYKSFYSADRLGRLGIGFAIGGLIANTNMDREVQSWYQQDVRSTTSDRYAKTAKLFGEGKYMIPISLLSASMNYIDTDSAVGSWGAHTARAYLTGAPALLLMQIATGGSRPGEKSHDSQWRPFSDNNGVSGHAFIGAVPFLTLAKMNNENSYIKYLAYVASTAAAWSRVNDNAHYLSQIALGWYMAYESVDAVFDGDKKGNSISLRPMMLPDGYGIVAQMNW